LLFPERNEIPLRSSCTSTGSSHVFFLYDNQSHAFSHDTHAGSRCFMNIAIDVHSLGTQAGGNETYFRQLIQGLTADSSDNRYTLFYTHPGALDLKTGDRRFTFVEVPKNPIARLAVGLPQKLRELRPDVFHCQYVRPLFVNAPTVVSIHDLAYEHFPAFFHPLERTRLKITVRRTARRADHILTLSEFSAADIARRYQVSRDKITVTYLAASAMFHPRDKAACQKVVREKYGTFSPFILYIGRIQARKNLPRLVEAFAIARRRGTPCKLVLVGKKDFQFDRLEARIKELGMEDSVIFPGYVAFEDLPLFYNAADLFVFPSFFEGFGLPVIESMASGVPTITSRGSSLEEVAGDAAVLIDPGNTDSLAEAMERVLKDADLQRSLSEKGLRRSAEFNTGSLTAQVLDVYKSLGRG